MARRSQCSSAGDNPLDSNYLPPHYREDYRLAIDALIEEDLEGYYKFLQKADVVDFLSTTEIDYIQGSVQFPLQSHQPEQHFLEPGDDGSSDTYWPIHSDLDVPGLDLGWPQMHHFIGPTEVTTLVSPPEPDMPSIKEQARRLVKNAQQVIAVVMDMFTDVDMFADILNAAMRNVAVYIILDEQNAHHFVNMVMNCRVNLQSIQFLRIRTVSGVTYHCRSGKSFKGQMMNRFLLTDCRAVLSGNYSFMWSFEKIHRSMAHLFLGQLVSTFDEEFRILFAQSQPLVLDNMVAPMEEFGLTQKRPYPGERAPLFRDTRRFLSVDASLQEERGHRHSFDERMDVDWRMMPPKRPEALHSPPDIYGRFSPQQPRKDLPFEPGPSRVTMLDNPAFKRHSYAEGGRFSYPFLQQPGGPDLENQARQFHRGVPQQQQQPYPGPLPGPEADYVAYDKFWNQDFHSVDQYPEPGIPVEIQPPDNFDPVLNYLSSTRKMEFDQSSDKLQPPQAGSPHTRRHSQPYACQTSPTPSNSADQKQLLLEPSTHRKDPSVKRGLRNWRISSFLSAYDSAGDEGLPMVPPQGSDPFEEPPNPVQQTAPGVDLTYPKIPNVREFKVPAIPRASQMPGYIKNLVKEQPKKAPETPDMTPETSSTPSESSSSVEVERAEEVEPKEPKTMGLRREESFRRKFNPTVQRSSRLRSSLIFSSLEQNNPPDSAKAEGQQDEESEKSETEPPKMPFLSQVLGQRRSAREPYEWSRYIRSNTVDTVDSSKTEDGSSKAEEVNPLKDDGSKECSDQSVKPAPATPQDHSSQSVPQSKPEPPKPDPVAPAPRSLQATQSFVDMNDPDARLMFFKELAAKRKAEKATEAEKRKEKAQEKKMAVLTKEAVSSDGAGSISSTSESLSKTNVRLNEELKAAQTESCEPVCAPPAVSGKKEEADLKEAKVTNTAPCVDLSQKNATADGTTQKEAHDPPVSPSSSETTNKLSKPTEKDPKEGRTSTSADPEKKDLKPGQTVTALPLSTEAESSPIKQSKPLELAVTKSNKKGPLASVDAPSPAQVTDQISRCDSTSKASGSLTPSSVAVPPASASSALCSDKSETTSNKSAPLSDQPTGSVQSSGSDVASEGSGSTPKPSTVPQNSQLEETAVVQSETKEAKAGFKSSSSKPAVQSSSSYHCISDLGGSAVTRGVSRFLVPETSQTVQETSTQSARTCPEPVSKLSSPESPAAADSETPPDSSSSRFTTTIDSGASALLVEDSVQKEQTSVSEKTEVLTSADDNRFHSSPSTSEASAPKSALPAVSPSESTTSSLDQADQTIANANAQNEPKQPTPPSTLDLMGSDATPAAGPESPSGPDLVDTVLSPEADKAENKASPGDLEGSHPEQITTPSSVTPETATPTQPTSIPQTKPGAVEPAEKVKKTEDPDLSGSAHKGVMQESLKDEKIPSEQAKQNNCTEAAETASSEEVLLSPSQSKQLAKSGQSRYLSSTANVLASSNLRDDTKLLLEQISANSQSRSEVTKEAPVTDDEKEDEADKNAKREKEQGFRRLGREPPKSKQEREKLLERIQSMRKERRVYSRFEMAP